MAYEVVTAGLKEREKIEIITTGYLMINLIFKLRYPK
jgi:hypothetical protein